MGIIPLTRGQVAIVDDADMEWLSQWKWHTSSSGYAVRFEGRCMILMHRLILNAPAGQNVDHVNGIRPDNRRANIRLCDQTHNHANRHIARGVSQFKGVMWDKQKKKWRVEVVKYRKRTHGGFFTSEVDAAHAYDALARRIFGEFAFTNFEVVS